jgi:hypothetical protein
VQTQVRQCCSDFFNVLVGGAFFGMEAAAAAATAGRLLLLLRSAAAAVLGAAAAWSWATALVRLFVCVVAMDVELVRLLVKVKPEPDGMSSSSDESNRLIADMSSSTFYPYESLVEKEDGSCRIQYDREREMDIEMLSLMMNMKRW